MWRGKLLTTVGGYAQCYQSLHSTPLPICREYYTYTESAEKYYKLWYFLASHGKLKPIISAAKTIKWHINEIMAYFKHRITNLA